MESLSKAFVQAHGFRLKSAFAETLVQLLHPIGKVRRPGLPTRPLLIGVITLADSASRDEQSAMGQGDRVDLPKGKGDDVEAALLECSFPIGNDESLCRSRGSFSEVLDVSL